MKTPPSLLLNPRALASGLAALLVALIFSSSAQSASIYWNGAGSSWNTVVDWSTVQTAATPNPAGVPGASDTAFFNINGVNALQSVTLDANQTVGGLNFNLNSTGGVTLTGGGTDRTLTLGSSGIGLNAAAGPVTIGSATAGQGVSLILTANQSWGNNGSSLLTINNGVTSSASSTITLNGSGSGGVTINGIIAGGGNTLLTVNNATGNGVNTLTGANTYTGATTITKGTLVLSGANGALGNTATTISNGGVLTLDDRGVGAANANRMGTSGITLSNGSTFKYLGSDQAATNSTETLGAITLGSGISTITMTYGGTNAATVTSSAATGGFTRAASTGGLSLINGTNLGANTVAIGSVGQFLSATGPTTVGTTAGGSTGINAAAKNTSIAIFRLGESGVATGLNGTATGTANTFLTYNATTGYRPLNPTDEFTNNAITATNNTYLTTGTTSTAGTVAINSLVVNGGNLSITGGDTLTNTSGMLLFAQNGSISGAGTFALGGASNQEGVIALNAGVNAEISSRLATGTTGLTLYGAGTLTLSGSNSYTGTTTVGTGVTLIIASNSALGSSSITALGGTIKGDGQARSMVGLINTTSALTIAGGSDLTFTGGGGAPAFTNATFANTQVKVNNTGTTTFSGVFSLNNAASGSNNGSSILTFGSSANVVITGPIQDNNAGNVASPTTGFGTLPFTGVGANLTISGNNGYGAGRTTSIVADGAYNTVTVGGPGGAGATVTPFGASTVNINTSNPLFLVAETNGQILGNNFNSGGSGFGVGFAGTNSMTLGGTWTASAGSSLTNLATGTFTFGNTISGNSLTLQGTGNTTLNSSATMSAGAFALTATQAGTVTLSNVNNFTGVTSFFGGTVVLDYGTNNNTKLTQNTAAGSATALSLGGVNLQLSGGTFTQTLGTPSSGSNGTTLTAGQSSITQTSGSSTIALGALARAANNGGVINFGTGVATTTTANNSAGILGGWATVNGTDWAVANGGASAITALGSYSSMNNGTLSTTGNYIFSGATPLTTNAASQTITTLKMDASANLTIGSTSLTTGGLLFTGSSSASITGGALISGGELIIQNYGSGVLTLASSIGTGSNAASFSGTGTTVLGNAANAYTGATFLNGGIVQISAIGNLGNTTTSSINFNGGTLETTAGFSTSRPITLATNGGTFQVDTGTLTSTGVISGTSYKGLTKTGAGTLLLQGTNTFLGPVTVTLGTLQLGNAAALGASSTASNRSVAPVLVNGGTLDINGQTTALGNVTLQSGAISDTAGTGTLAAYSFNLQSGTVGAKLVDLIFTGNTNSNSINLYKTTSGTVTLSGANTYTGNTNISGGTLQSANNAALSTTGVVNVNNAGSTLAVNYGGGSDYTQTQVGTLLAKTNFGATSTALGFDTTNGSGTYSNALTMAAGLTKLGSNTLTLSGANTYTGSTLVSSGTLVVNGSVTSSAVSVSSGATLGGSGTLAGTTISGAGQVGPGNSPGILAASQVDPSGGLDFNFEFTNTGAPTWSNATGSVNDVLRLTNATSPFTANLTNANVVNFYLNVASLAEASTYQGGFFTDRNSDFLSSVQNANKAFYVFGNGSGTHSYNSVNYYTLAEYNALISGSFNVTLGTFQVASADFSDGTITNGWVTDLTVVPEPSTWALLAFSLMTVMIFRRRRA